MERSIDDIVFNIVVVGFNPGITKEQAHALNALPLAEVAPALRNRQRL